MMILTIIITAVFLIIGISIVIFVPQKEVENVNFGIGLIVSSLSIGLAMFLSGVVLAPATKRRIELPKDFQCIKSGDTLTIEELDNCIKIDFYHNLPSQKNSKLLIVN